MVQFLALCAKQGLGLSHNRRGIQAVFLHQLRWLAAFPKLVLNGNKIHRCGVVGGQTLRHTAAETTETLVLFGHEDMSRFLCRCKQRFFVKRLDGMHVEDFCVNAVFGQFHRSLNRLPYEVATRGNGEVHA